jgi:hypothetical protein
MKSSLSSKAWRSLGVDVKAYSAVHEHEGEDDHSDDMVAASWDNRIANHEPDQDDFDVSSSSEVAMAVLLGSSADHCRECAHEVLDVVDPFALVHPFDDKEASSKSLPFGA